jgi:anti-sigma regulatory factor (Ser/Thr protein kinase)
VGELAEDLIRLELNCDQDAPCLVREAVDEALQGSAVHQDARLIASELVTNAVRYSGCEPEQLIEFRARIQSGVLLISVTDPCISGLEAHLRTDSGSGFGLRIVDRLARRWGSEHPDGQRVWAELLTS